LEISSNPNSFVNQFKPAEDFDIGIIAARYDLQVPLPNTFLAGQADHICLTATHNSLLFQKETARHVEAFLRTGKFQHAEEQTT